MRAGGVVVSPSISLGLAKFNLAATGGSQAASGRCASIDAVSLLTMPQLAGNPLDWFLLPVCGEMACAVWNLLLQRHEAQLHRLEVVETRFSNCPRGFLRVCYASDRRWLLFTLQSPS